MSDSHSGATETALTGPRATALEMWIAGKTDAEVGAALGHATSTIWRWRTGDPQLVALLAEARQQRRDAARVTLDLATLDAIEFLAATMRDSEAKIETRVRCAEQILDRGGLVAPKGAASGPTDDDSREATPQERAEYEALIQREIERRAAKGER